MASIPIETGTLTTVLNTFITAFTGGFARIYPDAMNLLSILATLEVAIAALWWMLCEENTLAELLKKIMKIGFFIFVVTQYQFIIHSIMDGFVFVGLKAGGADTSSASISLLKNPSAIIDIGFELMKPIDAAIGHYNAANIPKILLAGLAELLVMLAFFALAIGIFITYLEFYLVAVLGLILMPFGACKYTAFLAEKVFGAIISFGVRLMVFSFILATAKPVLASLVMPPDPDFKKVLILFLITATIAGLSWHASAVAGGLLSGSPSLTAGTIASTGLAVGAGVVGAGMAVTAAAGAGVSATRAAAGAMHKGGESSGSGPSGSTSAGSSVGSSDNPPNSSPGGSPGGSSGGGTSGRFNSPLRSASTGFGSSGSLGESATSPGDASDSPPGQSSAKGSPAAKKDSGAPKNDPKKEPAGVPSWALLAMAQRAIPQDAHSGAGVSVPLRND